MSYRPDLSHLADHPVVAARVGYLTHMDMKSNDRARDMGLEVSQLPAFIAGLQDLGLIDIGERLTTTGSAYLNIALQRGDKRAPLLKRRDIWQRIGGNEARLDKALQELLDAGLIVQSDDGYAIVLS
jgi:hypothetical protein